MGGDSSVFRGPVGEKVSKFHCSRIDRFSMVSAKSVSTMNMPFEAGSLLKLEKIQEISLVLKITIVSFSG